MWNWSLLLKDSFLCSISSNTFSSSFESDHVFTQKQKGMKRYRNFCRLIFSAQFLNFIGTLLWAPHSSSAFDIWPKSTEVEMRQSCWGRDLWTNFPILRIPSLLQEYPEQKQFQKCESPSSPIRRRHKTSSLKKSESWKSLFTWMKGRSPKIMWKLCT